MVQASVNYSMQDVANFAYNAGFRGTSLAIATAIAWAESGGNSSAVSSDGYNSHGLWQFIPGTWNSITNGSAFTNADNPQANANAAFALQQKSGWGQWSTYTSGAYLKNMPAASLAATNATASQGKGTAKDGTTKAYTARWQDWVNNFLPIPLFPTGGSSGGISGSTGGSSGGGSWVASFVSAIFKPLVNYSIDAGLVLGGFLLILFGVFELWNEVKK